MRKKARLIRSTEVSSLRMVLLLSRPELGRLSWVQTARCSRSPILRVVPLRLSDGLWKRNVSIGHAVVRTLNIPVWRISDHGA